MSAPHPKVPRNWQGDQKLRSQSDQGAKCLRPVQALCDCVCILLLPSDNVPSIGEEPKAQAPGKPGKPRSDPSARFSPTVQQARVQSCQ